MNFICLGSSSSGNGYLLRASNGETLIIEAGVKLDEVKRKVDFDLSKIIGVLVTHSHLDHSGKLNSYQMAGLNIYINDQTRQSMFGERHYYNVNIIKAKTTYQIGSFKVQPFPLKHDVENFGFLIDHPESGLFCFVTDTHYCPYTFPGLNNILIELNYSDAIVEEKLLKGNSNMFVRNRVLFSHMELQTAIDFLKANDLSKVNNIVLLHLSEGNSNAAEFQKRISEITGKSVHIAQKGLNINFDKTSF